LKQILLLEGQQIPVIHTYGKKGYDKIPIWRKRLYDLQSTLIKRLTDIPVYTPKAFAETIIIEKWQEKYVPGISNEPIAKLQKMGYKLREIARKTGYGPLEIRVAHGFYWLLLNTMLNEGIDEMWDLVDGTGGTTLYNAANARVGVGNSNAAVVATQTGLQGASTAFAAMDGGFPTSTTQKLNCKGSFPTGQAEFAWEEYTIDNGSVRNKNLNRALQSNGTKPSGQTWTLEVQITLS